MLKKTPGAKPDVFYFVLPPSAIFSYGQLFLEQEGYRPKSGQSDNGVNYSADDGRLSAEHRRNQVNAEQADAAPVERSDYYKDQCCIIHYLHTPLRGSMHFYLKSIPLFCTFVNEKRGRD